MRYSNQGRLQRQIDFLRRQFLQEGDSPFSNVLSEQIVSQAMTAIDGVWKDRIYSPLITLWVFLGQVISADHSCRAAVARLIAHRLSRGKRPCSAETGAYCQARKRLPEKFFSDVARQTGRALDANVKPDWLWHGRRVYAYDGSTVAMPDTPENQGAYPQNVVQRPGIGFPIARIAAIFSLASGAVLDLGICRYAGKGQSELGILRTLWGFFRSGDVLLADRYLCSWTEMVMLQARGVDLVTRLHVNRTANFRRGARLGKGDHIVRWRKPNSIRSVDRRTYRSLPEYLTVRETRVRVEHPGFRSRTIVLVTTMLDAEKVTKSDLAELYRARWNAELDLRSLKQSTHLDILRCKTPELVRKEIWTHVLAYNLIRSIAAQAAAQHAIAPRSVSFKGTMQTLEAFQSVIAIHGQCDANFRLGLCRLLLDAIATHRVGDRPDRFEPRLVKRRPKRYGRLMKPRSETKLQMLKQVTDI